MNYQYLSTLLIISGSTLRKWLWENLGLQKQSIISIEINFKAVRQNTALNNTSNRLAVRTTGYTPTSENYLLRNPGKSLTNSACLTLFIYLCNPQGSHWCIIYVYTELGGPQAKCITTFKTTSTRDFLHVENYLFVTTENSCFPLRAPEVPLWRAGGSSRNLFAFFSAGKTWLESCLQHQW